MKKFPVTLMLLQAILITGCATKPPEKLDNVCDIFRDKDGWYEDAVASRQKWGVPVSVMMAFMHQESRFVAGAKPPRKQIWGFIPGPRPSDAYGYSQAKNSTWEWYKTSLAITVLIAMISTMLSILWVGTTTQLTRPMALRKTTPSDCTSRTTRGMAVQTRYLPV